MRRADDIAPRTAARRGRAGAVISSPDRRPWPIGLTPSSASDKRFAFGVAGLLSDHQNAPPAQAGVFAGINEFGQPQIYVTDTSTDGNGQSSIELKSNLGIPGVSQWLTLFSSGNALEVRQSPALRAHPGTGRWAFRSG